MIVHWPLSALHHIKCLSQQGCFKDEVRFFFFKKKGVDVWKLGFKPSPSGYFIQQTWKIAASSTVNTLATTGGRWTVTNVLQRMRTKEVKSHKTVLELCLYYYHFAIVVAKKEVNDIC